jgi:HPt (histidine-containing phosphotransfer) domain-containing protein
MDYYELVCNFIAMHRGDMVLLQQLLADGQTVGASGLVHKLIGIASMIGANRIVAEAHLLMQELRRGADKEVLEEHIARCAGEFNALIAEMESLPAQCGMR